MAATPQLSLLGRRRFGPFFLTQFLGAFNDNVFKNALIVLIAFRATGAALADTDTLINLSAGLFILPFFLLSAMAGQLADKFEKARLIRWIKALEVVIMAGAAVGFYLGHVPLLVGLLFLMGAQSTLFGPVKYAILPQHLRDEELVGGNGLVEMGTFLAILLGTVAGGLLVGFGTAGVRLVAITVVVLAALGYATSRGIPAAPAADPGLRVDWNPLRATWNTLRATRESRTVFLSILGISWFWFYGATILAQLPNFAKTYLGGNEQVVTLLLALFSLGIGLGSLLCERLSGGKVELGLVPFGSIGLTVFGAGLFFATPALPAPEITGALAFVQGPAHWFLLTDVVLLGVFGGFYIVPLYALVQQRSAPDHRARVLAGNNILNALFMVAAALLAIALLRAGLTIPQLFLATAVLNAAVAVYIYTLLPEFLMRFLVWMLVHTLYRVRKEGLGRIPDEGPAVLVCNHVSYVDALIIGGCCRRPIRFVMDHRIYKLPVLHFIFRTAGAIPIASATRDRALMEQAFAQIDEALRAGDVVCIFPEGQLTRHGEMNPFRRGIERILARNPVPVVPMALRGLWGSFFSFKGGPALAKPPRRFWSRIGLAVGTPLRPEAASAEALQASVLTLRGAWR